jgi:hypothetical protein
MQANRLHPPIHPASGRFGFLQKGLSLEHFLENWSPVFRQKMRPLDKTRVLSGSLEPESTLAPLFPGAPKKGPRYGIGSAVVDLIFSIAKREVTFLSGTAAIIRL